VNNRGYGFAWRAVWGGFGEACITHGYLFTIFAVNLRSTTGVELSGVDSGGKMKKVFWGAVSSYALIGLIVLISNQLLRADYPVTIDFVNGFKCINCNVVLISVDTLRVDHLGVYGYHRNSSAYIDSAASYGAVFMNAYSPAPWTLPSHVSMLTGLWPSTHGVQHTDSKFMGSFPTIASRLREGGYDTAGFAGGAFLDPSFGLGYGFNTYDSEREDFSQNGSDIDKNRLSRKPVIG
jgi:hypothetical protein